MISPKFFGPVPTFWLGIQVCRDVFDVNFGVKFAIFCSSCYQLSTRPCEAWSGFKFACPFAAISMRAGTPLGDEHGEGEGEEAPGIVKSPETASPVESHNVCLSANDSLAIKYADLAGNMDLSRRSTRIITCQSS